MSISYIRRVATCELVLDLWCTQVVVSAQPTVSRRVDSKDLWFVRRTASDSIVVRGGWHPRRQGLLGILAGLKPITPNSIAQSCAAMSGLCELVVCLQADAFGLVGP